MKPETRYRLEKRIKELENELSSSKARLYEYKEACSRIHTAITDLAVEGKTVHQIWILKQFRSLWK